MQPGSNVSHEEVSTLQAPSKELNVQYANFCQVTGSPEEVMLDFAILAQPVASGSQNVAFDRRVVMTPFTAKRMLGALSAAIRHYEQVFGTIETDVRNRVRNVPPSRQASPASVRPSVEPASSIEPVAAAKSAAAEASGSAN